MSSPDDPNVPWTLFILLISVALIFVIIVGLQAWFYDFNRDEIERKRGASLSTAVKQLRAEQLQTLNEYRWIDRNTETVGIPIERAMELLVEEYARGE